ncbi:DUF3822 family protein [uncultured Bacteroides sp.]|uniref:DUF3822 family protein n=1 Tax=uncultured Bacteroides sp. TaxID=162156 RepID=UPI0026193D2C|nr:DUF3822 family protein [uncultured Bacteroides sp.]
MTNENIDFTKSEQYTLSIRLSTDGFSFSIYNPLGGSDFYFRSYAVNTQRSMAANVKSFLAETDELNHSFKQTNILIHTSRYTPVPLEFFEDEQSETLFYQNLPKQNNELILCNVLGKSNVVILFSIDKLTHLYLSEKFPDARFFSTVSPQIEYFCTRSKKGNNDKLFANLHNNSMDVFGFIKGRLQLVNSYSVTTREDRCYYLLNIWKQVGFDQETDELHLTGMPEQRNQLMDALKRYIRHIFIINPQADFNESHTSRIEEIPFDIQSLLICE